MWGLFIRSFLVVLFGVKCSTCRTLSEKCIRCIDYEVYISEVRTCLRLHVYFILVCNSWLIHLACISFLFAYTNVHSLVYMREHSEKSVVGFFFSWIKGFFLLIFATLQKFEEKKSLHIVRKSRFSTLFVCMWLFSLWCCFFFVDEIDKDHQVSNFLTYVICVIKNTSASHHFNIIWNALKWYGIDDI